MTLLDCVNPQGGQIAELKVDPFLTGREYKIGRGMECYLELYNHIIKMPCDIVLLVTIEPSKFE